MRLTLLFTTVFLLLTACTPEKLGAWLRTQSGTIATAERQAKDAATLAKMKLDETKRTADAVASRAAALKAGVDKLQEGNDLIQGALTEAKKSSSSSSGI
ncbi:MAG: hypothetical protein WCS85_03750 [Candidatus Peribacteraceae bacterium]